MGLGWIVMVMVMCLNTVADAFLVQTYQTRSNRIVRKLWPADEVNYLIDDTGSDDMSASTAIQILRESFKIWEDVESASLQLIYGGLSSSLPPVSTDGRNVVIFDEDGTWLDVPTGSGVIAVTRIESNSAGSITDADIIFNGRDFEFTSGTSGRAVNLKDVAVHEVGHLLGLDHTPLRGSPRLRPTMNPFYGGDGPGEASSLEPDDVAGISYLYPGPSFGLATGTMSGSVFDGEGKAVLALMSRPKTCRPASFSAPSAEPTPTRVILGATCSSA